MGIVNITRSYDVDFVRQIEEESGQNLSLCYQCGNCTAGCPYTFVYDYPVSKIMRLAQSGQKETVLKSKSLWFCATCESCTTRCPNNIDVAHVMDVLRHMARREGYAPVPTVKTFWDSFLDSIESNGRVFEIGLLASYVTKTGRFWTDLDLGPKVLPKGKMHFKPPKVKGKEEVKKIFKRFRKESHK